MLRAIKPEIRIIGWDDAPFTFEDKHTLVLGVVCRGGIQIDGLIAAKIEVDGMDATDEISKAILENKHKDQLRVIMLDGITFGGFNIVDIEELHRKTKLPVIVIIKDKPDLGSIRESLSRFKDKEKRWETVKNAGEIKETEVKNKVIKVRRKVYYQAVGMPDHEAEEVIKLTAVYSSTPEPIRSAHIICNGLKREILK